MLSSAAPPQPNLQKLSAGALLWNLLSVHHRFHAVLNAAAVTRGGAMPRRRRTLSSKRAATVLGKPGSNHRSILCLIRKCAGTLALRPMTALPVAWKSFVLRRHSRDAVPRDALTTNIALVPDQH